MDQIITTYRYQNKKWIEFNKRCSICDKVLAKTGYNTHNCKSINTLSEEKFMPIQRIVKNGEVYYRWGDHGKMYKDRKDAEKQAQAAYAHGYKENKKKQGK